jgi:hypothetical protein
VYIYVNKKKTKDLQKSNFFFLVSNFLFLLGVSLSLPSPYHGNPDLLLSS